MFSFYVFFTLVFNAFNTLTKASPGGHPFMSPTHQNGPRVAALVDALVIATDCINADFGLAMF